MTPRLATLPLIFSLLLCVAGQANEPMEAVRAEADVPALGAAVSRDGKVTLAVSGEQIDDDAGPVQEGDAWHIGSCGKAFTATLAARLVEQGKLAWNSTLAEVVPELKDVAGKQGDVTVKQLLSHSAGIDDHGDDIWPELWKIQADEKLDIRQKRLAAARAVLQKDHADPGSEYRYSNAGYMLAAIMMETVSDASWEDLMRREVFEPLGITTADFGVAPKTGGHSKTEDGWMLALNDNPQVIGPAGTMHLSLGDWLKFCQIHLEPGDYLTADSIKTLHAPVIDTGDGQQYALGWLITPDNRLAHEGSNTHCHAIAVLVPEQNLAIVSATNAPDRDAAYAAIAEIVRQSRQ